MENHEGIQFNIIFSFARGRLVIALQLQSLDTLESFGYQIRRQFLISILHKGSNKFSEHNRISYNK